jgi:hypothetical protein
MGASKASRSALAIRFRLAVVRIRSAADEPGRFQAVDALRESTGRDRQMAVQGLV